MPSLFIIHPRTDWLSERHTFQRGSNWIIICRFIARCSINITTTKTKKKEKSLLPVVVQRFLYTFVWHFRAHHAGRHKQWIGYIPFIFLCLVSMCCHLAIHFLFCVPFQYDVCLCGMTLERIMLNKYWYGLHFYYTIQNRFWILCDRMDLQWLCFKSALAALSFAQTHTFSSRQCLHNWMTLVLRANFCVAWEVQIRMRVRECMGIGQRDDIAMRNLIRPSHLRSHNSLPITYLFYKHIAIIIIT